MRGLIFTGTPTSPKKSTPQRKPGSVHAKENQAPPTPSSLFGSPSSSSRQQQQQPAESPLPASGGSQAGQGSSSFREDQSKPKTPEVFAGSSLTSPRTAVPAAAGTPHHATTPSPRKTPVSMKSPFAQSDKPQFHSPVRQDSISNNSSTKETPAETIAEVTGDLVSYNIFKLLHKLKT